MDTPIFDFVEKYKNSNYTRLHMPGHKGLNSPINCEDSDITEITGADSLYEANGIIEKSESNATQIFGSLQTLFSTEGSTQCIKAMLFLAVQQSNSKKIVAARNVHKAFIYAAALLDFEVDWLYPKESSSICSCDFSTDDLIEKLENSNEKPFAVYITSPDYLGKTIDIKAVADICHYYNVPLLVDNAHGAYLRFLNRHPINLGADICCDSAHKTLPCLTGAAYLHIMNDKYLKTAKNALSLFGSTSPSYLTLQSLDLCNNYLNENYQTKLYDCINKIDEIKENFCFFEKSEPLKLVINANKIGYSGNQFSNILRNNQIECEYSDNCFVVLMFTPSNSDNDFAKLTEVLNNIEPLSPIKSSLVVFPKAKRAVSIRRAVFSEQITISAENSLGKISGNVTVSCPPAIPIVVSGEIIQKEHIDLFKKYSIKNISILKNTL